MKGEVLFKKSPTNPSSIWASCLKKFDFFLWLPKCPWKDTCIPLNAVVAIASHIVSAFRKYLKLTKAKANLKLTYVAKPRVSPYLGPQTLSLFTMGQSTQLTIFQQRKKKKENPPSALILCQLFLCILCYKLENIYSPFYLQLRWQRLTAISWPVLVLTPFPVGQAFV